MRGTDSEITGIVLMGGRSRRMGKDKGSIAYHDHPHYQYIGDLLETKLARVVYSCRTDHVPAFRPGDQVIVDLIDIGPMGGLFSVFSHDPRKAKLVVAVDLPYVDPETVQSLIDSRDPGKIATAFRNPVDGKPEPFLAIWEPTSFRLIQRAIENRQFSPREILIHSDVNMIDARHPRALINANTPEEYKEAVRYWEGRRK